MIDNPNDTTGGINGNWYCERHPTKLMGHDGCGGAGITAETRNLTEGTDEATWAQVFAYPKHLIVVAWRRANGRWFVFRDRPAWFVQWIAELKDYPPEEHNADSLDLTEQAIEELRLRRRRNET